MSDQDDTKIHSASDASPSSELLNDILSSMEQGLIAFDRSMHCVCFNERVREILCLPQDIPHIGMSRRQWLEACARNQQFPEEDQDVIQRLLMLGGEAVYHTAERRLKNGRHVHADASPRPDGGVVVTFTDVSEIKNREDQLEASLQLFDDVISSMEQGLIVWTRDGLCLSFNQRAIEILEITPDELKVGTPRAKFLTISERRGELKHYGDDAVARIEAQFASGEPFNFDRRLLSGRIVRTDIRPRPHGGAVVTLSDVTDLKKAMEDAQAADRLKSEFLANMSHEIRTPMNGILGMATLLEASELSDDQRSFTRVIKESGQSLLAIINDILDFSKIEAGQMELRPRPFDLERLAIDVVSLLAPRSEQKALRCAVSCQPGLPTRLFGDPDRFRQILINLIGNAVKFTDQGYVLVKMTGSRDGDHVDLQVEIEDTGKGIHDDKMGVIFEKFSQADNTYTRQYEGTGLGLAITRNLIKLMGGVIGVRSKPGSGSTFWFKLRLPVHTTGPEDHRDVLPFAGTPILIADRSETSRAVLIETLADRAFKPVAVASASAAIEALQDGHPYKLVIIDDGMVRDGGETLLHQLRTRTDLRTVLLSAKQPGDGAASADLIGIDAELAKPVHSAALLDVIVTLLNEISNATPSVNDERQTEIIERADQTRKILIVEDDKTNQKVLQFLLSQLGYEFLVVNNGREALQRLSEFSPDLVLMDVAMPIMDGLEAVAEIRKHKEAHVKQVPVIGVTAHAFSDDEDKCMAAGMDDYLSKPIDRDLLAKKIDRWIGARRAMCA